MTAPPGEFDALACPLAGINLIEASAGTGKTWNICALYLRLLLESELDVTGILVVTFTKAATAELRERIRCRITGALEQLGDDGAVGANDAFSNNLIGHCESLGFARGDMRARLDAALQNFDQAAIHTIHSFCQRALADTPLASGAPFELDLVPDDSEGCVEAAKDFWRRRVAGDELPPALAAYLLANKDTPVRWGKLLVHHMGRPLARAIWPVEPTPKALDPQAATRAWQQAHATWRTSAPDIIALLKASKSALHQGSYKPQQVDRAAADWESFFASADPLAPLDREWKLDPFRLSALQAKTREKQATPSHPFFDAAEAYFTARGELDDALSRARRLLLRRLFDEGAADVRRRKRERRIAGYDDLLWNLHAALTGGEGRRLAATLRKRYRAVLVDEFQDTDPLQFGIFDAIHGGSEQALFLVGDPKQAIYSFRHADVHAYLRARAKAAAHFTLTHNQRATPQLIQALNAVFGANPRAFILEQLTCRPALPGARAHGVLGDASLPRPALQLWSLPSDPAGAPLTRTAAQQAASAATAAEISRLLRGAREGTITLDGKPLLPKHIAVLVHTHREGRMIRAGLAELGVGSVELGQTSVYSTDEARELRQVLAAVAEPARGDLLRAALATAILGRDALAIDRMADDDQALTALATRFAGYHADWARRGFGAMFRRLLAGEQVATLLLPRAGGERSLTNLLHLGELAQSASAMHASPDALLRWLDARSDDERDDEKLLRLESDRDLVQVVTIHKAKGLEFEVVFCPFLWDGRPRGRKERRESRDYHDHTGTAVADYRVDDDIDAAERLAIDDQVRLEAAAEALRIIYVALTRASRRCYLVAGGQHPDGPSTRSLLNWLVAGDGMAPADWLGKGNPRTGDDIAAAWAKVAVAAGGAIGQERLPDAKGKPLPPDADWSAALHPALLPQHIAGGWRIGSFSGLALGAANEGAATDHDARIATPSIGIGTPPPEIPADDILRFPRGRSAGDCLHAVFEKIDFADASGWDGAIADALRKHPQPLPPARAPHAAVMITRLLRDVLATPLPAGFALDAVARERRLAELEFHLPAPRLDPVQLDAELEALGYAVPRLNPRALEGYLKGFIDLVFEHDGRHYLADWKSNHLGYAREHYGAAPLAQAMAQHGYHLQYLLYSIALRRWLRHRLPGFDSTRHLGGVFYLFVRGVRPGWIQPDGSPCGVYFARPADATLDRLEALLGDPQRKAS